MGDMTGDAPQPGETPRNEGDPWSYADPEAAWWRAGEEPPPGAEHPRHPRPRSAPADTPAEPYSAAEQDVATMVADESAEAREAGTRDTVEVLDGEPPSATADPEAPEAADPPETAVKGVEQRHDDLDAERFNTEGEGTAYAARSEPERAPSLLDLLPAVPVERSGPEFAPDVMILPEPDRNRPTVALDRGAVPGQSPAGLPKVGRDRKDSARADRALQDRVRQERTSALLETSPFWRAAGENPEPDLPPADLEPPAKATRPPRRGLRDPRRPATGLLGLLALGLIAAFFAWVSAEPFWLAVGHGDRGSATVVRCTGSGVTQRCTGRFAAADDAYRVDDVILLGVAPERHAGGSVVPARMVSGESRQAYAGDTGMLVHLRWVLSFVLVLLCGLGIAGLTGALRLDTARARHGALLISVAGPLVLLAGFLVAAY
jgi:hypothetical protein